MKLTATERERISDGVLKIQSVRASIEQVEKSKLPNWKGIDACLEDVDDSFREALGYKKASSPEKKE